MFATLADSFTSRVVHIGMDEAHLLGRGRYADLHGVEERFGLWLDIFVVFVISEKNMAFAF